MFRSAHASRTKSIRFVNSGLHNCFPTTGSSNQRQQDPIKDTALLRPHLMRRLDINLIRYIYVYL